MSKDTIYKQDAVSEIHKYFWGEVEKTPRGTDEDGEDVYTDMPTVNSLLAHNKQLSKRIKALPSAEPTLYGYNIEHLELIAIVLQKENLPPERVVEALTDVGRIVAIVKDEIEEALKRDVERWVMNGIAGTVERRSE